MIVEILNKFTGKNIDTVWQVKKIWESCERIYILSVGDDGYEELSNFNANEVELCITF